MERYYFLRKLTLQAMQVFFNYIVIHLDNALLTSCVKFIPDVSNLYGVF